MRRPTPTSHTTPVFPPKTRARATYVASNPTHVAPTSHTLRLSQNYKQLYLLHLQYLLRESLNRATKCDVLTPIDLGPSPSRPPWSITFRLLRDFAFVVNPLWTELDYLDYSGRAARCRAPSPRPPLPYNPAP